MSNPKTCYIIGPIGKPDTPIRTWANFIREYIIKPAVTDCGYAEPARADDPEKELIMLDIIAQMFNVDLVIADLTDYNPNVFYELGIRHCAKKPVIHLIRDDQKPPFDLGGNKAIFISRDHEKVIAAISNISERVQAIEKHPEEFYSQVQVHIQLNQLELFKESKTGFEQSITDGLKTLLNASVTHENMLSQLYDEIVLKSKQVKVDYIPPYRTVGEAISVWENLGLAPALERLGKKKLQEEEDTQTKP